MLDPKAGKITKSIPVVEAWEGQVEWQEPHPAIVVSDDIAYVTEPAVDTVHAVNLTSGGRRDQPARVTPNEIAVAAG